MESVLFSPIGNSDPTRGDYDGPLLHIIRKYSPKKAYLFLTKEMYEHDLRDNRYEIMSKFVKPEIEIVKEVHEEIDRPNDFLIFDDLFKKCLYRIKKENPDCEILINITSGTGQITASLYMLASTLTFPVKLIQVDTPEKKSNKASPVGKDYDIESEKNNLLDNLIDDNIVNRCREINPDNVIKQNMINSIESHLLAYDYEAAKSISELDNDFFSEEIRELLKMAKYRSELDHKNASLIAQKFKYDLYPLKSSDVIKQFEYMLYIIRIQKKKHLNDFARALTPVIFNIFLDLVINKININIKKDYSVKKGNTGAYKLLRNKLAKNQELLDYYDNSEFFPGEYKDSDLSATNILPMISFYAQKNLSLKSIEQKCLILRGIESSIRNQAAHEIVAISEEDFIKQTGFISEKIVNVLKELFEFVYNNHQKNINWDSYDNMNQFLIKNLKEVN